MPVNMLLTPKQVSIILDDIQKKFGHILGQTWSVAASKVASLPDGSSALSDKLSIWNGQDTFVLDCKDSVCQLSKLIFEKKEGWGIPFIWGCAQQAPEASLFAVAYIGSVDAGSLQQYSIAQYGGSTDATASADVCEGGNAMCLSNDVTSNDSVEEDTKDTFGPPCVDPNSDGDLSDAIVDPSLRMIVRKILGTSSISAETALKLTNLPVTGYQINVVDGLQCFPNLQNLQLGNNNISDLTPLQGLTQLTSLVLYSNPISDISQLQTLTNLTSLDLSKNQIGDLSPLQSLTQLTFLNLSSTGISDLSPLQGLVLLTGLHLETNQVSDVSPLMGLVQLTDLYLDGNQISDVSPLQGLNKLKSLDLHDNKIGGAPNLQGLSQLQYLNLSKNKIGDISSLQGLIQLESLVLYSNQIADISALQSLTKLMALKLDANQVGDISALKDLTQLHKLNLQENKIINITSLQSLTELQYLNLQTNNIGDVTPLILNSGLGANDAVWLDGNPLIPQSQKQQLMDKAVYVCGVDAAYGSKSACESSF